MKIIEISSSKNPFFKKLLRLAGARGIKKYQISLLSGARYVKEVLRDFSFMCKGLVFTEPHTIPEEYINLNLPAYLFSPELFHQIDFYGTRSPILIVKVPSFPRWIDSGREQGCTLFLPFQDPANMGACIRAAAAFGVPRIVALKDAAHPYHPKSLRAAGSCVFRVKILQGPFLRELEIRKIPCITLSPDGKNILSHKFASSFALIAGLEGPGLPLELSNYESISIPMDPGVESLNAAMATGITLFLWKMSQGRDSAHLVAPKGLKA